MWRVMVGILVAGALAFSVPAGAAAQAAPQQDSVVDRVGDWFATLGKSGMERDSLLAQRKAERMAKRSQQAVERQARQAERGMQQTGKELNKGLGSLTGQ
ncbi:MAG: hypothetical protein HYT90_05895 [Candidatus Omnitrophica bacterium]|nr:hypothetical protein [Candidatus Omnitrophota bacterium]